MKKLTVCLLTASLLLPFAPLKSESAVGPLPGFYPDKIPVKPYDPGRYTPRRDAVVDFLGAAWAEKDFAPRISLDGDWKFSGTEKSQTMFAADADLGKGMEGVNYDDSKWPDIKVPSDFYKKYPADPQQPYVKGWYRKTVEIPAVAAGKRVILHFGVIGYEALLYVNGKRAGSHHGDFTPWDIDITDLVQPGGRATLAIRVFSDLGPSVAVGADKIITTARHPYGSQYAASNIKAGIWQSASLNIVAPIYVAQALINPDIDKTQISVDCTVINCEKNEQKVELYTQVGDALAGSSVKLASPLGKTASLTLKPGENKFTFTLDLTNPKFWSPDDPNLYHLTMLIAAGDKVRSVKTERFGYRGFKAEGDHFLLNHQRIYLFGESMIVASSLANGVIDQDQPDASTAARRVLGDKLLGFKSRGSNALRLSEQPAIPEFLDIADEVGIIIYNMWAWSYNDKLDPSFEETNCQELTEWLTRDYNHAAVLMWLGGNEVKCNEELAGIFDRQTDFIRAFDKSGRPVSVFSGAAYGYAKTIKLNTDVLDLHSYLGLGEYPWSFWNREFDKIYNYDLKIYAPGQTKLPMPYIIWELVGFSWGQRSAPLNQDTADDYMKWGKGPTTWGRPNGIGWAGSIGLAAALDKNRGGKYAMDTIGRRIMEYVRQDVRVCGFAPWFLEASITLPSTNLWTQPVFCGMRGGKDAVPLRNPFGGSSPSQNFYVVNSSGATYNNAVLRVSLAEADTQETPLAEIPLDIAAWGAAAVDRAVNIPAKKEARWAQIRLRLVAGGREISRNYYDVYIQNQAMLKTPLPDVSVAAILPCGSDREAEFAAILHDIGITAPVMKSADELKNVKVLFVAPSRRPLAVEPGWDPAVREWIKNGGTLAVMEQEWAGEFPLIGRSFKSMPCLLADLALPRHAVFNGLSQHNFEFWDNPESGLTATYVTDLFAPDIVAVRPPLLNDTESYAILSEGKLGDGRVILSQFAATSLWGRDSAASLYLRNLLAYATAAKPANLVAWPERQTSGADLSDKAEFTFVNLRPYVNMGFADEVEGDGKGGWTDQGKNDFRMIPPGCQTFKKVPYDIIDPAQNDGNSCIVVAAEGKGNIVPAVKNIKIGAAVSRLFFLHTEAYVPAPLQQVLCYRINYADDSSVDVIIKNAYAIGDWWRPGNLPDAGLAYSAENPAGRQVGAFTYEWRNPRPDVMIKSLDVIAAKGPAVCILLAVTGEQSGAKKWPLGNGSWAKLADGGAAGVVRDGPMIPRVETVDEADGKSYRVMMPARKPDEPRPVVFTRFDNKIEDASSFRYLVMDVQSDSAGLLELAIPDAQWQDALRHPAAIQKSGEWQVLRISLDKGFDMQHKNWGLDHLRGEFYIYSGADRTQACPAMDFKVRNIRLE